MPYDIRSSSTQCEGQFAVIKEDDGKLMGCHASRDEAEAQVAALYASERKKGLMENIKQMTQDFISKLGSLFKEEAPESNDPDGSMKPGGFLVWKERGEYRWMTRYSNNFRDRDFPPEIISGESHKTFVKMVEAQAVPLPDLWMWHVPEWKVGAADWVTYDETEDGIVYALAGGHFDKEAEWVAEAMANVPAIGVSHGMPYRHLVRDPHDPSIIVQHVTHEISPLIPEVAANRLADFTVFKKEVSMAIPDEKRQVLTKPVDQGGWGLDTQLLSILEEKNSQTAKENLDLEHKEASEPAPDPVADPAVDEPVAVDEVTVPEAETLEPKPVKETMAQPVTAADVAQAMGTVFAQLQKDVIQPLQSELTALRAEVTALRQTDDHKIEQKAQDIPAASLAHLIARSVIGSEKARVDGREQLAKARPDEAPVPAPVVTGVSFLDTIITQKN